MPVQKSQRSPTGVNKRQRFQHDNEYEYEDVYEYEYVYDDEYDDDDIIY
jgi:hypothetical protein